MHVCRFMLEIVDIYNEYKTISVFILTSYNLLNKYDIFCFINPQRNVSRVSPTSINTHKEPIPTFYSIKDVVRLPLISFFWPVTGHFSNVPVSNWLKQQSTFLFQFAIRNLVLNLNIEWIKS